MGKHILKRSGQTISTVHCAPPDKWDDPFPLGSMVLPEQRRDLMKDMGKVQSFLFQNPSFTKSKKRFC